MTSVNATLGGPRSYSQGGQDLFVVGSLFPGKTNGIFLEIGAFDGETYSNTALLERAFGWTGLCIEPQPEPFAALKRNRTCACVQAAATSRSGEEVQFQIIRGYGRMLSGRVDTFADPHKMRIARETERHQSQIEVISVPTIRAADALRQHGFRHVDYASIDVEGGEIDCIKGLLDPDIPVLTIGIENNYGDRSVNAVLTAAGYRRIDRVGGDDFYRLKSESTSIDVLRSTTYRLRHWKQDFRRLKRKLRGH